MGYLPAEAINPPLLDGAMMSQPVTSFTKALLCIHGTMLLPSVHTWEDRLHEVMNKMNRGEKHQVKRFNRFPNAETSSADEKSRLLLHSVSHVGVGDGRQNCTDDCVQFRQLIRFYPSRRVEWCIKQLDSSDVENCEAGSICCSKAVAAVNKDPTFPLVELQYGFRLHHCMQIRSSITISTVPLTVASSRYQLLRGKCMDLGRFWVIKQKSSGASESPFWTPHSEESQTSPKNSLEGKQHIYHTRG
ncbi:hypothetical protein BV898_18425 [Hypsibius exemplaris]|uniref:Uncharacterized protein n=1 Tax=Hypsibius exemplaris TaxID=2072580 RepID=A0A9X6NHQ2_HYPEX|nr:hypothetical protein BV898_18425 [Hypsibius exemplaris]